MLQLRVIQRWKSQACVLLKAKVAVVGERRQPSLGDAELC